jgi:hypothetical protein
MFNVLSLLLKADLVASPQWFFSPHLPPPSIFVWFFSDSPPTNAPRWFLLSHQRPEHLHTRLSLASPPSRLSFSRRRCCRPVRMTSTTDWRRHSTTGSQTALLLSNIHRRIVALPLRTAAELTLAASISDDDPTPVPPCYPPRLSPRLAHQIPLPRRHGRRHLFDDASLNLDR